MPTKPDNGWLQPFTTWIIAPGRRSRQWRSSPHYDDKCHPAFLLSITSGKEKGYRVGSRTEDRWTNRAENRHRTISQKASAASTNPIFSGKRKPHRSLGNVPGDQRQYDRSRPRYEPEGGVSAQFHRARITNATDHNH